MHLARLTSESPKLAARGMELLRQENFPQMADVESATGTMHVDIEGEGEVYLVLKNGAVTAHTNKPDDAPVPYINIALRKEAIDFALSTAQVLLASEGDKLPLQIDLDHPTDDMARALVTSFSGAVGDIVRPVSLAGRAVVRDAPDHGDLAIDFSVGALERATTPKFTVQVYYDDLEDVRHGDMTRDQLVGRLRIQGDAAPAVQLSAKIGNWMQKNRTFPGQK